MVEVELEAEAERMNKVVLLVCLYFAARVGNEAKVGVSLTGRCKCAVQ